MRCSYHHHRLCAFLALFFLFAFLALPQARALTNEEILTLSPVSPYTEKVLQRSDKALKEAAKAQGESTFDTILYSVLRIMSAADASLIDTELRINSQRKNLEMTACLHRDLLLLEAKMADVQKKRQEALKRDSAREIYLLDELLLFLNDRFGALLQGALDPTYEDRGWSVLYPFDPPGWCCDGSAKGDACLPLAASVSCTGPATDSKESCLASGCPDPAAAKENTCPFHSDYLPPLPSGYGCDGAALRGLTGTSSVLHPPTDAERRAAETFERQREEYLRSDAALRAMLRDIRRDLRLPPKDPPEPYAPRAAKEPMIGCGVSLPPGTGTSPRNAFSFPSDVIHLLERLQERWIGWAGVLPVSSRLKLKEEDTGGALRWLVSGLAFFAQRSVREGSEEQARAASGMFQRAVDAPRKTEEAVGPLRQALQQLGREGMGLSQGVRGFVRDFSAFLRRSCIERSKSCDAVLDRVLKTTLDDDCFPYTSGDPEKVEECGR